MTPLEFAISKVSVVPITSLCLVHVTLARYLKTIVRTQLLTPSYCAVFDKDLLYFSYGAPYYKPQNRQTEDELEFPVAFVFDSLLLSTIEKFYPFDTGAVATGMFGATWTKRLARYDELYVTKGPERLVSCFYGSNTNYLRGAVQNRHVPAISPLSMLHGFLAANLSAKGADQRQRTIECMAETSVELQNHLHWVAFPDVALAHVQKLWRVSARKFDYYHYAADVNDNPASLVAHIAKEARKKFGYQDLEPS